MVKYDQAIEWLIETVYTRGGVTVWPSLVATDCEVGLTNVVDRRFSPTRTKRVICRWHIMKNISTNCKAAFGTNDRWEEFETAVRHVISAKTREEYYGSIVELKNNFSFNDGSPFLTPVGASTAEIEEVTTREVERKAVSYVLRQWLDSNNEYIVAAWVDRYFHCGITSTSRVEGGHRRLKDWIGGSTGGLQSVISSCRLAISSQMSEISLDVAAKENKTPLALTGNLYVHCVGLISPNGLYMLRKQYDIIKNEAQSVQSGTSSTTCTGLFTASFGILCWHKLKVRLRQNQGMIATKLHVIPSKYHTDRC